jgi:hypothetical protein
VFVSIGDAEKLNAFLDKNPAVPRSSAFVDGYDFGAYSAVGFESLGAGASPEAEAAPKAAASRMKPPALSGAQWWSYLTTVGKVSPIPPGLKFGEVPQVNGELFELICRSRASGSVGWPCLLNRRIFIFYYIFMKSLRGRD